jgi:pimeloyl-ACP methyl ester carboxylesterase
MAYADINGLHLYFEEHGQGPPLVLLHGGLMTVELNFGAFIPTLSEHRRVIAVELQGNGRTADTARPMSFGQFAADVVGLLDHLDIDHADVFGFSLGGLVTYQLLVDHPGRVRRAVVASADHDNERGGERFPERLPTADDAAAMRTAYAAVSPDPDHFEAFVQKTAALVHGFGGWTDEQIRAIDVPVLVLIGDTDFVLVQNAAEAAGLLPHGQLAVLAATTHVGLSKNPLVPAIVEQFLSS